MIKATVKFKGVGQSSWSEVYYFSGTFSREDQPFGVQLQDARCEILDNQCVLKSIRYTNPDGTTRASAIYEVGKKGTYASGGKDAALPGVAIVYTLTSNNPLAARKLWLHGVNLKQYSVDQESGEPSITAAARELFDAFTSIYRQSNGVIRALQRGVSLGSGLYRILSMTQDTENPENSVLTTGGNTGFAPGQQILIRGADKKTAPGLNGTYMVLAAATNTVKINYRSAIASPAPGGGALIRSASYGNGAPITGNGYHGILTRKVKESFFDSRGARSRTKLRHSA